MSYFMLPKLINPKLISNIQVTFIENEEDLYRLSPSLNNYLNNIKKKIDNVINEWDIYKRYTNPYEYIHSIISNSHKTNVSKLKPLSRSFYKMIEIITIFNITDTFPDVITTFHLAEGPGGFIEALVYLRDNSNDKYYGMTLISDSANIPSWKKSKIFMSKNKNVIMENGISGDGDLTDKANLLFCLEKYHNSMDFITGDGGFDFSINFNKQEEISQNLIFCQICFAIAMQKTGGTFVLKIFDVFMQSTLDLLYILSICYERVFIIKPNTSRIANSEKYIVCRNFLLKNSRDLVLKLSQIYDIINKNIIDKNIIDKNIIDKNIIVNTKRQDRFVNRFLDIDIPSYYVNKLEEINAIIGQQQIENMNTTFSLIKNNKSDKIEQYKNNNINKSIFWCQKFNIPYNQAVACNSSGVINSDDDAF